MNHLRQTLKRTYPSL